ncbi:hypothetical protein ACIP17_35240 [Streptomyces iakyrus]|uniref:hypothetical protein n=1 Tax=Streptomyces iakyrus TaxID=68219 RepID=UPI0037F679FE
MAGLATAGLAWLSSLLLEERMGLAMHAVTLYLRVTAKPGSPTAERAQDRLGSLRRITA